MHPADEKHVFGHKHLNLLGNSSASHIPPDHSNNHISNNQRSHSTAGGPAKLTKTMTAANIALQTLTPSAQQHLLDSKALMLPRGEYVKLKFQGNSNIVGRKRN